MTLSLNVDVEGAEIKYALAGRNDFLLLNPDLPAKLGSGDSLKWLTKLETIKDMIDTMEPLGGGNTMVAFRVEAQLGSGDTLKSERYSVAHLPFEVL